MFRDSFHELQELENEIIRLKLKAKQDSMEEIDTENDPFDIVEEFIGPELREFYKEYEEIEEYYKKARISKVVAAFVVKTWKEKTEDSKELRRNSIYVQQLN